MVELFDAHAHLQDERIRGYVDEILRTGRKEGVAFWACNGTCEADWPEVTECPRTYTHAFTMFPESLSRACNKVQRHVMQVQALAMQYPAILPQFGHHPYCLGQLKDGWQERLHQQLLQHPEAGLGEVS